MEHWDYSKLIVHGKYERIDFPELLKAEHYHQFVDTCLGKGECYVSLTYAEHLAESILLGMIANRLPKKLTL